MLETGPLDLYLPVAIELRGTFSLLSIEKMCTKTNPYGVGKVLSA